MARIDNIKNVFRQPIEERWAQLMLMEHDGFSIKNYIAKINGHTFYRTRSYLGGYLWISKPTRSERTFYLLTLNHAHIFANTFPNTHSTAYWDDLYRNMKIYQREVVIEQLVSSFKETMLYDDSLS